jgi:hypothetical protein
MQHYSGRLYNKFFPANSSHSRWIHCISTRISHYLTLHRHEKCHYRLTISRAKIIVYTPAEGSSNNFIASEHIRDCATWDALYITLQLGGTLGIWHTVGCQGGSLNVAYTPKGLLRCALEVYASVCILQRSRKKYGKENLLPDGVFDK